MQTEFTPWLSLLGGALIGLSSLWLLAATGRIAGISGIVSRLLPPVAAGAGTGTAFVAGLLLAVPVFTLFSGAVPQQTVSPDLLLLAVAGLLVGFGAVFGNGCTSGHGVCGISRLSQRSIIATAAFMFTAVVTVFMMRHVLGA